MTGSLLALTLAAAAALELAIPAAAAATPAVGSPAASTGDPAVLSSADARHDFGAGTWGVADGGNTYLGQTTKPGQVKVNNAGPGRVAVHLISPWGFKTVIHLPPGGQLCKNLAAGWSVEVWDAGQDGNDANGTCFIP